ncbi:MAG: hypothetical protein N2319_06695 [Candidatus Kapabacteria bacterium]|nr:hypothetical protein [Candidatus Kapabacteria bacterium]
MLWKYLSIISLILVLPVIVLWLSDSNDYGRMLIYSMEQKEIKTEEFDPIFGQKFEKTEIQKGFWLGLLPPTDQISLKMFLGVIPLSSTFIAISVFGLIMLRIHKKRKQQNPNI